MKKLQVFISSTYLDMIEERQAAVEAILRAGHIPAGMELFAAADESQWETIRRWIDDSDVFMLILGGRYGSIEPASKRSYVENEYSYAVETKKPFFAAVMSEARLKEKAKLLKSSATESDESGLFDLFRKRVTSKTSRFFSDSNELKVVVFESLARYARNEALVGWVRGDDVVDPKSTLEEMSRLRAENSELQARISDLEAFMNNAENQDPASSMNDDARRLLKAAAMSDGYILHINYIGGAEIQAGGIGFVGTDGTPREEARWRAALEELVSRGCVDVLGSKGETYRVTKLGYEIADKLEEVSA
jgi:Domain of unknown function (DUF4062)